MAITNHERVGKPLELPCEVLAPSVERGLTRQPRLQIAEAARRYFGGDRTSGRKPVAEWNVAALFGQSVEPAAR